MTKIAVPAAGCRRRLARGADADHVEILATLAAAPWRICASAR